MSDSDDPHTPEYTSAQITALTARSEALLVELHEVMREMADRLQVLAGGRPNREQGR